ncbi:SDR family oxidoreductase [Spirosoma radiotolerans]|uniref:Short-chain dehydrogenase n=1 Tax=Spirosoma radiotolerans TaxID=1379870 RepID=A0A0E3VAL0_9BACT|nr:SDR family NAD(P)-dependent oxidoreductase [Spirosoma radiotolerans]AKD58261.1 short-chain dehydrogenase [Spirosoma radiotolerans]
MNLTNNTILVTGGTGGFGVEFATKLMALGNTVIITGRNARKLEEVKRKLPGVHTLQSDVSKAQDIINLYDKVIKEFPDLNILINNAGEMRKISLHHPHELTDITREVEINLMGPIRMVQQFLPHLKTKTNAAILNVSSGIALMTFPISPIYSASKSGLRAYTQALRVQLKHTGISVFELIAPGSSTPLNDKFQQEDGFSANALMAPEKIVDAAIKGMQQDQAEIYPGLAKLMRVLSRVAPKFILSQSAKMGASFMYENQNNRSS